MLVSFKFGSTQSFHSRLGWKICTTKNRLNCNNRLYAVSPSVKKKEEERYEKTIRAAETVIVAAEARVSLLAWRIGVYSILPAAHLIWTRIRCFVSSSYYTRKYIKFLSPFRHVSNLLENERRLPFFTATSALISHPTDCGYSIY